MNSFHVELLLAQANVCSGIKTYGQCLFDAFQLLADRECRALQDPIGISGLVRAANTEAKREKVQAAVADSAFHAVKALLAEAQGDTREAVDQWDLVFDGNFPRLGLT